MDNDKDGVNEKVKNFCNIIRKNAKKEKNPLKKQFINKGTVIPEPTEEEFVLFLRHIKQSEWKEVFTFLRKFEKNILKKTDYVRNI